MQHAPLPSRYLARNPHVTSPGVLHNCPDLVRQPDARHGQRRRARIFPISANLTTADSHAGTYSAACGVHVARGDALPAEYVGRAWSCDPTGNLVRYDALEPAGGTFHARRVRDGIEAFRSRDDWFRPVFLADGPDGALYVCDMYRKTIEHPEYLPEEVRKHTDFESGKDMGRIWRTRAGGRSRPAAGGGAEPAGAARVAADGAGLVAAPALGERLDARHGLSPDHRTRRRRVARGTPAARSRQRRTRRPPAVVCCAQPAGQRRAAERRDAPGGDAARRRRGQARARVTAAEPRLAESPELAERVLALTGDPHVHVRYAAVLAAGGDRATPGRRRRQRRRRGDRCARRAAASPDVNDKWFRAALCTSLPPPGGALAAAREADAASRRLRRPATADGDRTAAAGTGPAVGGGSWSRRDGPPRSPAHGNDRGLRLRRARRRCWRDSSSGVARPPRPSCAAAQRSPDGPAARTTAEAAHVAADAAAPLPSRVRAVELLSRWSAGRRRGATLLSLVAPDQAAELAIAAVRGLVESGHGSGAAAAAKLLEAQRWARYTPALRSTVLTLLSAAPGIRAGDGRRAGGRRGAGVGARASPSGRGSAGRRTPASAPARRSCCRRAGAAGDGDRGRRSRTPRPRYSSPAAPPPAGVFLNHCANCHRLDREGYAVGPDLYGIRNQPKESILLHIVIPEQEVAPNFAAYDCVTTDGRTLSGIMTADTPASITLRQALGIEETIPRENVKRLQASRYSLMPPGLEQAMSKQELADLLAYLRGEQ